MAEATKSARPRKSAYSRDDLVTLGVLAGVTSLVGLAGRHVLVKHDKRKRLLNDWENEQRSQGRVLYQLIDGRYLAVQADSTQITTLP